LLLGDADALGNAHGEVGLVLPRRKWPPSPLIFPFCSASGDHLTLGKRTVVGIGKGLTCSIGQARQRETDRKSIFLTLIVFN
jgi:hypothetical protein